MMIIIIAYQSDWLGLILSSINKSKKKSHPKKPSGTSEQKIFEVILNYVPNQSPMLWGVQGLVSERQYQENTIVCEVWFA